MLQKQPAELQREKNYGLQKPLCNFKIIPMQKSMPLWLQSFDLSMSDNDIVSEGSGISVPRHSSWWDPNTMQIWGKTWATESHSGAQFIKVECHSNMLNLQLKVQFPQNATYMAAPKLGGFDPLVPERDSHVSSDGW